MAETNVRFAIISVADAIESKFQMILCHFQGLPMQRITLLPNHVIVDAIFLKMESQKPEISIATVADVIE
jgi:hypothetical protein